MTVTSLVTADELFNMPDGSRYELVRGELRKKMSPTGFTHGDVESEIGLSLRAYVKRHRLGKVVSGDVGFRIARNPDTVLGPDVAFVRRERVVRTDKFFEGPPDLAIEVVSPDDSAREVKEKASEWLRGGTLAVIVVDPRRRTVRIHRPTETVDVAEEIAVDDIVPGWHLPLSEIFED